MRGDANPHSPDRLQIGCAKRGPTNASSLQRSTKSISKATAPPRTSQQSESKTRRNSKLGSPCQPRPAQGCHRAAEGHEPSSHSSASGTAAPGCAEQRWMAGWLPPNVIRPSFVSTSKPVHPPFFHPSIHPSHPSLSHPQSSITDTTPLERIDSTRLGPHSPSVSPQPCRAPLLRAPPPRHPPSHSRP